MLLFFFILFPILLMSMFGFIYPPTPKSNPTTGNIGTSFPNLPVSLVQMDDGQTANLVASQFIQISGQQRLFTVSESASYQAARNQLVEGNLKGIIVIPEGFSAALAAGRPATVQVTVDETNPTTASVVQGEISAVFSIIGSSMSSQNINTITGGGANPAFILQPISVRGYPLSAASLPHRIPGTRLHGTNSNHRLPPRSRNSHLPRKRAGNNGRTPRLANTPRIDNTRQGGGANRTWTYPRISHPRTIHTTLRSSNIRQPNHHVPRLGTRNSKLRRRRHNPNCCSSRPKPPK